MKRRETGGSSSVSAIAAVGIRTCGSYVVEDEVKDWATCSSADCDGLPAGLPRGRLRALRPRRRGAARARAPSSGSRSPRPRCAPRRWRGRLLGTSSAARRGDDRDPGSVAPCQHRSARRHRPRPPEGRRHRARARLLRRRPRLRAAAADGRPGRVHLRRRLPPPHRPRTRGRAAAAARRRQARPASTTRRSAIPTAPSSPTRCAGSSRPGSRSPAPPITASARRST